VAPPLPAYYADLHMHSRFAYATSRNLTLPVLDATARKKGVPRPSGMTPPGSS
jgi:PHP family Zn ribbon phosphoesterase